MRAQLSLPCLALLLGLCSSLGAAENTKPEESKRPLILLTNDDGINSAGIKALMKALPRVADVVVVAPATAASRSKSASASSKPNSSILAAPGVTCRRVRTPLH